MGEQLVQGCYLAARLGFEPATLRSTGIDASHARPSTRKWECGGLRG